MALTQTEKFLIAGLKLFDLTEEEQESIFLMLQTEEQQVAMMDFLAANRNATQQDILWEMVRILRDTRETL